jgi:DnaJ domain
MNAQEPQFVDYYARLGVPADASLAEIKSAYRNLVKRYHPDVYPFDDLTARRRAELAMRQINEAYAVLSNSAERQRYDEQFQEYIARCIDSPTSDASTNTEAEIETRSRSDWPGIVNQWLSDQRVATQQKPVMGVFRKALLVPIPFCMATAACSAFWNIGQITGAVFLGGLTAVLCYPLILGLLLPRLVLPIRHASPLSIKQKLVGIPVVMTLSTFAGWLWLAVVDHSGTIRNPWDLCWWCGLIGLTCAILAYL